VLCLAKDDEAALESARKLVAKDNNREKLLSEKVKIEKRLDTLSSVIRKLYEDCVTEVLSGDNYQAFVTGYQKEQTALTERLATINGKLAATPDYEASLKQLKSYAAAYATQTELTAEMLTRLISRIEIGYPTRLAGKIQQEITIIYRFINTTL
jgi:hypothetical protein